jgi:hypothetical protein
MSLRVCSILGTVLLALAVANPASAEKKKKNSDDTSATSASFKSSASDAPMASAKGKAKKKKKKEEPAPEPAPAETAVVPEEEAVTDSNTWEKPPVEQEKPAAPVVVAPVEKPDGDGKPWSAGLLLGWGFKTDRQTAGLGADPYGFAAGIRGGYSLDFNLYVGLFYTFYLGSSQTGSQARVIGVPKTTTANYMQFGAEVGYDWWVGPVVIRPSLQIGAALGFTDVTGVSRRELDMLLGPGLTVVHPWDMFFIGGDARFAIATGSTGASAFLLALTGGLRFE